MLHERMKIFLAIILVIFFVNLYASSVLLNGNWESTDEFTESSHTKLYLNIDGHFSRDSKLVIIHGENARAVEGRLTFIGSPIGFILYKNFGLVSVSGFNGVLPKILYYTFDPLHGKLSLFRDKVYGNFQKL